MGVSNVCGHTTPGILREPGKQQFYKVFAGSFFLPNASYNKIERKKEGRTTKSSNNKKEQKEGKCMCLLVLFVDLVSIC